MSARPATNCLERRLAWRRPVAATTASAVARTAEKRASSTLSTKDPVNSSLSRKLPYHSRLNPRGGKLSMAVGDIEASATTSVGRSR